MGRMDKMASPAATDCETAREEAVWSRFDALMAQHGAAGRPGALPPDLRAAHQAAPQARVVTAAKPPVVAGARAAPLRKRRGRLVAAALGCLLALAAAAVALALLGPPIASQPPAPAAMTAPPTAPGPAQAVSHARLRPPPPAAATETTPATRGAPAPILALALDEARPAPALLERWSRPAAPAALAEATIRLRHGGAADAAARAARAIGETGATVTAQGGALAPPSRTEARYFRTSDAEAAAAAAALLGRGARPVDLTGYAPKPPPGVIEVWLGADG